MQKRLDWGHVGQSWMEECRSLEKDWHPLLERRKHIRNLKAGPIFEAVSLKLLLFLYLVLAPIE